MTQMYEVVASSRTWASAHASRLCGATLVIAAAARILVSPAADRSGWLVVLMPVLAGALAMLVADASMTDRVNGWDATFAARARRITPSDGKFARWFKRPLFAGSAAIWRWTAFVGDDHIRAGARLGLALYFWGLMLVILIVSSYVAIVLAVAIVLLLLALWAWSLSSGEASTGGTTSRASSGPSLFGPRKCVTCGSREHASDDCPHGIFATKCSTCGAKEHSSDECPHGVFASKCARCGSREHSSDDCPHGFLSAKCSTCGSIEHASDNCPHGVFSTKCGVCGSKEHATENCPH